GAEGIPPSSSTHIFLCVEIIIYCLKGGSGQRKLTPLPQGSKGYTGKILKTSSNNGKNIIYIVPLQEKIDTTPLAYDAPEFHNMPTNQCMACGILVPLQLLPSHLESCQRDDSQTVAREEEEDEVVCLETCPICDRPIAAEFMLAHASSCGESFPQMTSEEVERPQTSKASTSSVAESSMSSSSVFPTREPALAISDAWKTDKDPERAAMLYRRYLLDQKEDAPTLRVRIDIREDVDDQEGRLISFYKAKGVDWARPLYCKLEGDAATGDGVKRHFFSLAMQKLQKGFLLDFGNRMATVLFEGQEDHLIPSTSQVLVQSELFTMAGRMIGHSFLHDGPPLTGISPAVLHMLTGGSTDTAPIVLEDVADMDIRETIHLLTSADTLTDEEIDLVNQLAMSWDLPVLTANNHAWLLQSLLQHAVLARTSKQVTQLRRGLQEAIVLPLIEARPDVLPYIFPRQAMAKITAEMVLQKIVWPGEREEEGCPVAVQCTVAGYLRHFVETVAEDDLKELVKFWVGWELPTDRMQVEVVVAEHPSSQTCFSLLRLPSHYSSYEHFHNHLLGCIKTSEFGFGLI
ncbi:uncharacterized protein LOC134442128, partial [Engraulis encrasicolus]|uniref:uncharacterized protein LOC134442128 n=1 Tax=Engraulis encrasicolus TaxID=184585 RepID=UPI002FCE8CB8